MAFQHLDPCRWGYYVLCKRHETGTSDAASYLTGMEVAILTFVSKLGLYVHIAYMEIIAVCSESNTEHSVGRS
jgi:hypothetical protein